ncbi:MAG: gamma-glutamyltransferase [Verrucomicrobiota bacterium]|nr:gamma-glutamyltransferase [Verrucomicrobiota bacterium]
MNKIFTRREMLRNAGKAVVLSALAPHFSFAKENKISSTTFGAVASEPASVEIGQKILNDGGNAVDAVVGAALAAGITMPSKCGIGSYGGTMMIALANGKVTCIDCNSMAPAAARPDMYPLDAKGNVVGRVNFHGWQAVGIPGTLAGLQIAIDRYGTKSLRELLQPSIALAKNPPRLDKFVNFPALAKTLSTLADRNSVESFYRGDIAQEIADTFKKNNGQVTAKDLATYQAREVAPYQIEWKGYTTYTAPLGATGLLILEALAILKALNWDKLPASPAATHARLEAVRLAWKDRAEFFGDPEFVKVPVQRLLSIDYANELAEKIQVTVKAKKALSLQLERIDQVGTLNISAVDWQGNMAVLTFTQGNSYGAQVSVYSLGMVLGHGMARFDPSPGHPNSIAPGKRPVHNMAPSVIVRDGRPILAVGAAGGTKIPNALFDFFSYYVGRSSSMENALEARRMNCFGLPEVSFERGWPKEELDYLQKAGFKIKEGLGAYVSAVSFNWTTRQAKGKSRPGNPFQERN